MSLASSLLPLQKKEKMNNHYKKILVYKRGETDIKSNVLYAMEHDYYNRKVNLYSNESSDDTMR